MDQFDSIQRGNQRNKETATQKYEQEIGKNRTHRFRKYWKLSENQTNILRRRARK